MATIFWTTTYDNLVGLPYLPTDMNDARCAQAFERLMHGINNAPAGGHELVSVSLVGLKEESNDVHRIRSNNDRLVIWSLQEPQHKPYTC